MKKKNSTVSRKKLNLANSIFFNNSRIITLYKVFRNKIQKHIGKKAFAAGVSGGADSLCLAYFCNIYSSEFKNSFKIFIVDHKLRKNSSKESLKAKKILNKANINSKILTWKGAIPKKNIQFEARTMRYSLIYRECIKNKINFLITAHHQDDQIENFLIRLFRGSGLNGLSSMPEKYKYNKKFNIIRPFLNFDKKSLEFITKKKFGTYINDPSNFNDKFLRTRIRNYRKTFDKEGFDTKKIVKTVDNLGKAKNALEYYKELAIKKYVRFTKKKECKINLNLLFSEPDEIVFRTFSYVFSFITKANYPPRSKKIMSLISKLKTKNFKRYTLAKYIIEKSGNNLILFQENKKKSQ